MNWLCALEILAAVLAIVEYFLDLCARGKLRTAHRPVPRAAGPALRCLPSLHRLRPAPSGMVQARIAPDQARAGEREPN
jgi:hypothetical protein